MNSGKKPLVIILLLGLFAGLLAGGFYGLVYDLPEINQLKQFKPSAATTVYSNGGRVITRFYREKRFPVSINDIPENLINALIATEDRNFFSHSGINLKAILRAIVQDIKAGSFKQGASTLTQQLAKTLFLSPEKSIVRKIREALLSIQIERRYTKNEILELYLNLIYLGSGAYGVEAAARTYFDTSVSGLTLGQAALIAGLPKAPSVYSPLNNPERARQRRAIVLKQMLASGDISRQELDQADAEPVITEVSLQPKDKAPFFTAFLKERLKSIPGLGHQSGLVIHTTLNLRLQKRAQESLTHHLETLDQRMIKNKIPLPSPQGAVIALDVHTGGIRTMVGGRDFTKSQYNRGVQALRQPGSAFKPLVFAAALARGWEQNNVLLDAPLSYDLPGQARWEVKNFSRTYSGEITMRKALALSKNTPVVRLADKLSPQTIVDLARKAGITSHLPPYLSLALGTAEVSLLEMTSAYTPFANQGIRPHPHAIESIVDMNGRKIYTHALKKDNVLDRVTAALTADMLKAVMREGTGKRSRHIKKDIAGKTGTTDKYKDALFIGFSPDLVCGVWVGNDDATPLGAYETGAKAALPIWLDVMETSLTDKPFQYFDIPNGTKMIYIHPDTGKEVPRHMPGAVKALVRDN